MHGGAENANTEALKHGEQKKWGLCFKITTSFYFEISALISFTHTVYVARNIKFYQTFDLLTLIDIKFIYAFFYHSK